MALLTITQKSSLILLTHKLLPLLLAISFSLCSFSTCAQKLPKLGLSTSLENDSLAYASGFRLIGTSVSNLIAPSLTNAQFEENLTLLKRLKCKVYMCNVLFPGSLKIAGPNVQEDEVLQHLTAVMVRAKQAGIRNLVLGSGGARKLPEGYDRQKAIEEFASLGKKMATAAQKNGVTIILESLNSTETNFINTLKEAASVVRIVNHPNFRLNADIYHMLMENEPPQEIINAKELIIYAEIAEKNGRTFPGVSGQDFLPYLAALKKINYRGALFIEGRTTNLTMDAPKAFNYLTAQLEQAYSGSK